MGNEKRPTFDPRAGLWILITANIITFSDHTLWVKLALITSLLALMVVRRRFIMTVEWVVGYYALLIFQQAILLTSPMIIAASFTTFVIYTHQMFPCLMVGSLTSKYTPLHYLIVGLRQLHIPQKPTVAISMTLRYFLIIREEIGHIRDAMKLRNVQGLNRLECAVMSLMVFATETTEELSAVAVAQGVENPARKTSAVLLRLMLADLTGMLLVLASLIGSFVVQQGGVTMIGLEQVSFGHGKKQEMLSHISTTAARGGYVLLCGAPDCGKTTMTKLIGDLIPVFTLGCRLEERAMINGLVLQETPTYELVQQVGSMLQSPKPQFFNLDAGNELAFGLENEGHPSEEIRRRMEQVTETLHLQELRRKDIFSLSDGQEQLLAFGSVYAMDPEIHVLDEPTADLDQGAIARFHNQIVASKRQDCTIVMAEYRLYFPIDLIDQAFYLRSGVLECVFTGGQFYSLSNPGREALGLHTPAPAICTPPAAESVGSEKGLSVEGLACSLRKDAPVFWDLSFSAHLDEVAAITGPNGVGETTLSRCLCRLLKEQAGRILLDGKPLDRKGHQRSAFCVMQDVSHQLFSGSAWGECQMSAPEASDNQVSEVLDSFHLLSFRERRPMPLSGGQKQRLAAATALLSGKPVPIFDKPTSSLDYVRMVEVSGVVRSPARHRRTVLVVTHDQEFIQRAYDRMLRL